MQMDGPQSDARNSYLGANRWEGDVSTLYREEKFFFLPFPFFSTSTREQKWKERRRNQRIRGKYGGLDAD